MKVMIKVERELLKVPQDGRRIASKAQTWKEMSPPPCWGLDFVRKRTVEAIGW